MKRTQSFYLVGLVLLAGLLAACAGLDAGDLIHVKTPNSVQQKTGLPSSMTLNASQDEYRAYVEDFQRDAAQWKGNLDRGDYLVGVVNQFTLGVMDSVGPSLAGIPILGPALPLLAGLGGLFLRRPGDTSKDEMRKAKEDSYNAGIALGKKLAEKAVQAT